MGMNSEEILSRGKRQKTGCFFCFAKYRLGGILVKYRQSGQYTAIKKPPRSDRGGFNLVTTRWSRTFRRMLPANFSLLLRKSSGQDWLHYPKI